MNLRGFTVIELMFALACALVLLSAAWPAYSWFIAKADHAHSLGNLRQISRGIFSYGADNSGNLPGRGLHDKWPAQLRGYVDGQRPPYADPVHRGNDYRSRLADPFSNAKNETSYMFNGFNDLVGIHAGGDTVRLAQVERPSMTILVSLRADDSGFYMDLASNNQRGLRLDAHGLGSHFLFADGSARLVPASEYREQLWLARKGLDE